VLRQRADTGPGISGTAAFGEFIMIRITDFTPPPRKLTALVAALLAALVLPPAAANSLFGNCSRALDPTAQYHVAVGNINLPGDGRSVTGSSTGRNVTMNAPIVMGNHSAVTGSNSGERLQIRGRPENDDTAGFLWEGESTCVAVAGSPQPQFYSMFGRVYEHTQPLGMTIKACPWRWIAPKCSRTVNLGVLGTYTANSGYPPCGDNTQQTDPGGFTPMPRNTGVRPGTTFSIRIWGKLCTDQSSQNCRKFLPGGGTEGVGSNFSCTRANLHGYTATFAPGPNCGPPEWPTDQNRDKWGEGDKRFPPYARWCDFTVKVRTPEPGAIPDRKRFPGHPAFHEKHTIFKPGHYPKESSICQKPTASNTAKSCKSSFVSS